MLKDRRAIALTKPTLGILMCFNFNLGFFIIFFFFLPDSTVGS